MTTNTYPMYVYATEDINRENPLAEYPPGTEHEYVNAGEDPMSVRQVLRVFVGGEPVATWPLDEHLIVQVPE